MLPENEIKGVFLEKRKRSIHVSVDICYHPSNLHLQIVCYGIVGMVRFISVRVCM